MSGAVSVKVKEGRFKGKEVVFDAPARCFVGRARACQFQLLNPMVSRFHCLLDIDPPAIHIRDLGSRNGTFVNGELIGKRDPWHTSELAALQEQHEITLHSGDKIALGDLILEVGVRETPFEKASKELPPLPSL